MQIGAIPRALISMVSGSVRWYNSKPCRAAPFPVPAGSSLPLHDSSQQQSSDSFAKDCDALTNVNWEGTESLAAL